MGEKFKLEEFYLRLKNTPSNILFQEFKAMSDEDQRRVLNSFPTIVGERIFNDIFLEEEDDDDDLALMSLLHLHYKCYYQVYGNLRIHTSLFERIVSSFVGNQNTSLFIGWIEELEDMNLSANEIILYLKTAHKRSETYKTEASSL